MIASNIGSASPEKFTDTISSGNSTNVPCAMMSSLSKHSLTTSFSGTHLTRARLLVNVPGEITFGTVDLKLLGNGSYPTFVNSKKCVAETDGLVEFELDIDVGANETFMVQAVGDSGKLGSLYSWNNGTAPMGIWMAQYYKDGGSKSGAGIGDRVIYGEIYASPTE